MAQPRICERRRDTQRAESEQIIDSEAAWVIARLNCDGDLSSAEKRLLQFLGAEASSTPPALRPLIGTADLAKSA